MISRYQKVLSISDISEKDLSTLNHKNVLIIGVGGVGQHVLTYLSTNGVKNFTLVDFDKVEISNLNRQILLKEEDINKSKVQVVKEEILKHNNELKISTYATKAEEDNIESILKSDKYDLVIDATDNWTSKLLIAKFAYQLRLPLLHVGVDGYVGQYALLKESNLLDVVTPEIVKEPKDGVFGQVVGIIASMAALLATRYFLGRAKTDILYHYDSNSHKEVSINLCDR